MNDGPCNTSIHSCFINTRGFYSTNGLANYHKDHHHTLPGPRKSPAGGGASLEGPGRDTITDDPLKTLIHFVQIQYSTLPGAG